MSHADATPHDAYLGRKYFPELDGLRALSILLVVTFHLSADAAGTWEWLAGFRGVTVFFVLSGFLITTLALREEESRGRTSLAAFYLRRCCRLLPLYYLILGVYCLLVLGLSLNPKLTGPLSDALPYYLTYLQELPYYFTPLARRDWPFATSWTLGIEEKFYLLWPLLAFVLWRGAGRRRIRGAAVLAAAFVVLPLLLTPLGREAAVAGKMLFCYGSLLAGCLLAFLLHDPRWFARLRGLGGAAWTATVLAVFLAAHFATPWLTRWPWVDPLNAAYALSATALVGCALLGDGPLQRVLRWRPLVFVGRLSYGVYLTHVLCMCAVYKLFPTLPLHWGGNFVIFPLTCLLSVGVAWGLHAVVESPCIELGQRWSRRITEGAARAPALAGLPAREA